MNCFGDCYEKHVDEIKRLEICLRAAERQCEDATRIAREAEAEIVRLKAIMAAKEIKG